MTSPQSILIVEDDERLRDMLRRRLASKYARPIIEAEEGERALELLRQESVALVLLDLGLPGIDGLEVTRQIRALAPPTNQVPILMISAYPEGQYASQALAAGCNAYYQKPILDVVAFYETIAELLAKSGEN